MNPKIPDFRPTPEVIITIGAANGVGKTTTAMNLAVAFAASGSSILLIDLDARGIISNSLIRGWHDEGGAARLFTNTILNREMIAATEIPDLYLIPAEDGLNSVEHHLAPVGDSRTRLAQSLESLRALPVRFDLIVINCPSNLGLITINALIAAHWVIVPLALSNEHNVDLGIPALLTTIQRIRGGTKQPLRGVYLLPTLKTDSNAVLIGQLKNSYGPMLLSLAIPWSAAVIEANEHGKPLLVYAPHDPVSAAYLDLAAKCLELFTHSTPLHKFFYDEPTYNEPQIPAPTADHGVLRRTMEKRILAWLIDPSCLLYNADEAQRQPEPKVLEELIELTQQNDSLSQPTFVSNLTRDAVTPIKMNLSLINSPKTKKIFYLILMSFAGALLLFLILFLAPASLRFEIASWLIGPSQYWDSGSMLLLKADEIAYRELMLGAKLVGNNRTQLMACVEEAQNKGEIVMCTVAISPEQ